MQTHTQTHTMYMHISGIRSLHHSNSNVVPMCGHNSTKGMADTQRTQRIVKRKEKNKLLLKNQLLVGISHLDHKDHTCSITNKRLTAVRCRRKEHFCGMNEAKKKK